MADLARIKRNVAKMASMGAPEADIDGYIASEGVTIDDVKNFGRPQLSPMTDEQRSQAEQMASELRRNIDTESVWGGLGQGFVEGAKLFGENVVNGLTAGLYGAANRELGGDFKERNERAGANKYANIAGDILGSVAGAGTAAYNLAGRAGLKGVARLAGAGALESGVRGASEGDTVGQAAYNVLPSALVGGVSGGALGLAGKAIKRLVPSLNVIGKKSGLENALDDIETLRAINRGSRASDDVAQSVLNQSTGIKGDFNSEMAEALDRATGRKLNIQNAIDTQQKRLGQFVKQNENMELFTNNPLKAEIESQPLLSDYTQGLTDFQADALNKALAEGASKSTTPLGTLGATHRGQEVLNDMIEASFDKSMIGTKRPTTDTRQLMGLKERFNQILEPSGVKPFDESYAKAQALRTNFEKGYNFKPSETKFETLGLEKARDKRAFLQGRLSKILDNVTDQQSVSNLVKKDQNTLKKLMTSKKFSDLMKEADRIDNATRNIKNLETTATSALRRSSDAGRPLSELGETKSSMIGAALDRLFGGVYRAADANVARRILSGQAIPQYSNLLNASRASVPSISSILTQQVVEQ